MINQQLRWVDGGVDEYGERMMNLQYSEWDIDKGGYVWKNVPYVNLEKEG